MNTATHIATHTFPLVEVSGSAYDMGYQHGAQAADLVGRYITLIQKLAGLPLEQLCRNAMRFLPRIEQLSPRYVEEVRGLAAGAHITFEEALLCQARLEAAGTSDEGCSAFALTGEATLDHQPLAGQNQDLPPEYSDVAILLHVKPNDGRPRALIFTFAGQLGYAGMNQAGMSLFANALYDCPWQMGLPKYPVQRVLLEQPAVEAGVAVLEQHPLCSASNFVMADARGHLADVEVRPEGIAVFEDVHPDQRLHTNHHISAPFAALETHSLPDSCPRLDRLHTLIQQHWGQITVDTLKQILADHDGDPAGICRHGESGMHSISGYIAEPARGVLHVRRGHGCTGSWHAYTV